MFSKDDKDYLELLISPIRNDLNSVKENLVKINGRINKHDEQIQEALIERAANRERQKEVCQEVNFLLKRQKKTEEELMEYRFFKTHPRTIIYLIIGYFLLEAYELVSKFLL